MNDYDWWKNAVIYQIYPRSFYDANNDGIGDLAGIYQKVDYIARLGVDAVWISPFFKSPMRDFGYDISDYRSVDPIFGNMEDFETLTKALHSQNIKVMIDQVLSHTSNEHAWFQESAQNRTNPKADWYVWANPQKDGSPPNNWLSIFGGSAWEWHEDRQQYYLHNFLKSQPDLNFHNAEVQAQVLSDIEYWILRGVDGFRFDAINFCFHDAELRNNPIKPIHQRKARGFSEDNPYAAQYHKYDNTQDENAVFMEKIRALLNQYPGTAALGEINSDDSLKTIADYTNGNHRLHLGYSFELLADENTPDYIAETVGTLESHLSEGWPCWAISNHDVIRVATRWSDANICGDYQKAAAKMYTTMACSLRGAVCTYQGEELGLNEAHVPRKDMRDPFGIEFWPEFKGRDGCRTPLPWKHTAEFAGFSETSPWLPICDAHRPLAISQQEDDDNSPLHYFRNFLKWRKAQEALLSGEIRFIQLAKSVLCFERICDNQKIVACFNFTAHPTIVDLPSQAQTIENCPANTSSQQIDNGIQLNAYGMYFGTY